METSLIFYKKKLQEKWNTHFVYRHGILSLLISLCKPTFGSSPFSPRQYGHLCNFFAQLSQAILPHARQALISLLCPLQCEIIGPKHIGHSRRCEAISTQLLQLHCEVTLLPLQIRVSLLVPEIYNTKLTIWNNTCWKLTNMFYCLQN